MLIIALIMLLTGFIAGRLVGRIVGRLLHEIEVDRTLEKRGWTMPIEESAATLVSYLIYFGAILVAINHIGLTQVFLYMITGGAVLLVVVGTLLGIKDFIPNFIAGIFMYRKQMYRVGQSVIIKNVEGNVRQINIIETQIDTKEGDRIFIPNSLLIKSQVVVKKL